MNHQELEHPVEKRDLLYCMVVPTSIVYPILKIIIIYNTLPRFVALRLASDSFLRKSSSCNNIYE